MKLRLSNTWRVPYADEENVQEYWELREVDGNGKFVENGLWESAETRDPLLAIVENLRIKAVEEFYEV